MSLDLQKRCCRSGQHCYYCGRRLSLLGSFDRDQRVRLLNSDAPGVLSSTSSTCTAGYYFYHVHDAFYSVAPCVSFSTSTLLETTAHDGASSNVCLVFGAEATGVLTAPLASSTCALCQDVNVLGTRRRGARQALRKVPEFLGYFREAALRRGLVAFLPDGVAEGVSGPHGAACIYVHSKVACGTPTCSGSGSPVAHRQKGCKRSWWSGRGVETVTLTLREAPAVPLETVRALEGYVTSMSLEHPLLAAFGWQCLVMLWAQCGSMIPSTQHLEMIVFWPLLSKQRWTGGRRGTRFIVPRLSFVGRRLAIRRRRLQVLLPRCDFR